MKINSFYLSIYPFIYISIYVSIYISIYLLVSDYQFQYYNNSTLGRLGKLTLYLSIYYLSLYLTIYQYQNMINNNTRRLGKLTLYLSTYLIIHLSIYLPIYLSINPVAYLSMYCFYLFINNLLSSKILLIMIFFGILVRIFHNRITGFNGIITSAALNFYMQTFI